MFWGCLFLPFCAGLWDLIQILRSPLDRAGRNMFQTAESFGVSAQIGCGVVRGGAEVRFHEGSTRVPPGFHQGPTRVPPGFDEVLRGLRGGASTKKSTACCWAYHLSLFFLAKGEGRGNTRAWIIELPKSFGGRVQGLELF